MSKHIKWINVLHTDLVDLLGKLTRSIEKNIIDIETGTGASVIYDIGQ